DRGGPDGGFPRQTAAAPAVHRDAGVRPRSSAFALEVDTHECAFSVRPETPDVRERVRRCHAEAAGDSGRLACLSRVFLGLGTRHARRRRTFRRRRDPSHPDRPRPHPVPRRPAAARLVDSAPRAGGHVVHARAQRDAVDRGAASPQSARAVRRAADRAQHRLRRRRQPDGARRTRRPCLDRLRIRLRARLRVRERAPRDGPAGARARLVAVFLQPGRRDRAVADCRRGGVCSGGARPPQRGGGPSSCVRGVARGRRRGHVLVRAARLFLGRQLMSRGWVLGVVVGIGALSVAAAAYQAQQQAPAPKVVEVEKLKDNLYMLKGGGGNTAVFIAANGVVVVDTKNPGSGQPILDKIKALTPKPVTTIINTHTHADHVSGNVEFPATVDIVVQENTKANMEKMVAPPGTQAGQNVFQANPGKGMPKRTFKDRLTIGKDADEIDLYYFGRGHTNGDAWIVFPA